MNCFADAKREWFAFGKRCGRIFEHLIHRKRSPFPSRGRQEGAGEGKRGRGKARGGRGRQGEGKRSPSLCVREAKKRTGEGGSLLAAARSVAMLSPYKNGVKGVRMREEISFYKGKGLWDTCFFGKSMV